MKIRLEPQKTTLRISKAEFSELIKVGMLSDSFALPGGQNIELYVSLNDQPQYHYEKNQFNLKLPEKNILAYKPNKIGLSIYFQLDNKDHHHLLYEVDIKKKPLKK